MCFGNIDYLRRTDETNERTNERIDSTNNKQHSQDTNLVTTNERARNENWTRSVTLSRRIFCLHSLEARARSLRNKINKRSKLLNWPGRVGCLLDPLHETFFSETTAICSLGNWLWLSVTAFGKVTFLRLCRVKSINAVFLADTSVLFSKDAFCT